MVRAESLLGRRVLGRRGEMVGVVVDVGTGEGRSPKFLLVGPREDALAKEVLRVEVRDIAELAEETLRLR